MKIAIYEPETHGERVFYFFKKERVGIIFLVPVILVIAFLPFFQTQQDEVRVSPEDSIWMQTAQNLQQKEQDESTNASGETSEPVASYQADHTEGSYASSPKGTAFNFDPNTLDAEGFKKLGLRDKTIRTLINYRNKGGKFRKPDDLARVYGLRQEEFTRLRPYVSIPNSASASSYTHQNDNHRQSENHNYTPQKTSPVMLPKPSKLIQPI
ncbi:ComEA family DNA-binding protein [Niabella hibiscisoli]|uniref:ComEA family DNA-binding protein n=1 Tax=Niabella hibiscisoli TaxID=1825928 RepID=UPI001F10C2C6|nr:helix-hairpin-helix domain-containing protein [Niabella hibiscisoli]MCH5715051.1 helix-hairpin-helix domain-containing protein [Niabella hibiscisoli]